MRRNLLALLLFVASASIPNADVSAGAFPFQYLSRTNMVGIAGKYPEKKTYENVMYSVTLYVKNAFTPDVAMSNKYADYVRDKLKKDGIKTIDLDIYSIRPPIGNEGQLRIEIIPLGNSYSSNEVLYFIDAKYIIAYSVKGVQVTAWSFKAIWGLDMSTNRYEWTKVIDDLSESFLKWYWYREAGKLLDVDDSNTRRR